MSQNSPVMVGKPSLRPAMALYVAIPIVALVVVGGYGHWTRNRDAAQAQRGEAAYIPQVDTAVVHAVTGPTTIVLPGQTDAYSVAHLYARATGFVAERRVDIGSAVKRGDLLLRIAAPDIDQELAQAKSQLGQVQAALIQARANVDQARASARLAGVTNARTSTLAHEGWESRQSADTTVAQVSEQGAAVANAQAGVGVAEANVRAQQATVDRYRTLQSFEDVTAPFDGVVTERNVEVGDLVNADSGGGVPLFTVQREDVLRVVVAVPQSDAVTIRPGQVANVHVSEFPDRIFDAKVSRTAGALADSSRSLRVEVDVRNSDRILQPGLYVDVTFSIPRRNPVVVVPDTALIFEPDGVRVAVAGPDGVIDLRPVSIGHDQGTVAELTAGLRDGERVVIDPPADLVSGERVSFTPS